MEKGAPFDPKSSAERDESGTPGPSIVIAGEGRYSSPPRGPEETMSKRDPYNTLPYVVDRNWLVPSARVGCATGHAICFGPFRLLPLQRLLLKGDEQVRLGSRAFDILVALTERPGQLISKNELMARVWPGIFVVPANLTVHITALRRALGDGVDGNRFIVNVSGRGYCFTASVKAECAEAADILKQQTHVVRIRDQLMDCDEVA